MPERFIAARGHAHTRIVGTVLLIGTRIPSLSWLCLDLQATLLSNAHPCVQAQERVLEVVVDDGEEVEAAKLLVQAIYAPDPAAALQGAKQTVLVKVRMCALLNRLCQVWLCPGIRMHVHQAKCLASNIHIHLFGNWLRRPHPTCQQQVS